MAGSNTFENMVDSTGQPLSKMPDSILPSTNGVIFNAQGEVLLQQRADNGYWALPGGRVDIGESVEHGAIREVCKYPTKGAAHPASYFASTEEHAAVVLAYKGKRRWSTFGDVKRPAKEDKEPPTCSNSNCESTRPLIFTRVAIAPGEADLFPVPKSVVAESAPSRGPPTREVI